MEAEQTRSNEDQMDTCNPNGPNGKEVVEPDSTFTDTENCTPVFEEKPLKTDDEKSCCLHSENQKDEKESPQSQTNISNTSKTHAEQDIESVPKEEEENGNTEDSDEEDTSFCKPCGLPFDSAEKYYRHTRGILHVQRLMAHNLEKSGKSEQNSDHCSHQMDGPAISQQTGSGFDEDGDEICAGHEMIVRRRFTEEYRCKLCDIKTTGLDPIIEHVNGQNHKLVLQATKKGTPLPPRLQRKLGPNAEAMKSCLKNQVNTAQGSGPSLGVDSSKNVPEALIGPKEENVNTEISEEEDTSFCKICCFSFDSAERYYHHTRGNLHIQRLMAQNLEKSGKLKQNFENSSQQKDCPVISQQTGFGFDDADDMDADHLTEDYRCKLCDIKTTGLTTLMAHVNGKNHKLVQEAAKKGTPLPLRLQRKLGPNALAFRSWPEKHISAAPGSDAPSVKANLNQQMHKPNMPKNQLTFTSVNPEMVQKDCFKFRIGEGQGSFMRHAQGMASSQQGPGIYGNQVVNPSSIIIQFPEFNRVPDVPVCLERAQAFLSLRLLLFEEFLKQGVPSQKARAHVEERLKLMEQYMMQGMPFDVARERVIREHERWNLLTDFERQSLSFEEAEWRINKRFQLLDLYEKQGMQRADATRKIIQEEVVRDFKAEFVKLGYAHTEAQELAERRLSLLDVYHKHGLPPEEACRRLVAEEQKWRSGMGIQLGSRQITQYLQTGLVSSTLSCPVPEERDLKGAIEINSNHKTEEEIANRIGKLLQKLVPHNNRIALAEGDGIEGRDEIAHKDSDRFQPVYMRYTSEAEKEQLQEEFDRSCREEIQKLFAQLLEQQIPPDEARVRLQILKTEHENKRQGLFSKEGSQQEFWTNKQRPNFPEYGEFFNSPCRNNSMVPTTSRHHRSPSIESSSSGSLKRRAQRDGRHHRSSMKSRMSYGSPERRMQRGSRHHRSPSMESRNCSGRSKRRLASRNESRDHEELTRSVKKLYDITKSLGFSDIFEQLVKPPVTSNQRTKSPSSRAGPSHESDYRHHTRSPAPYSHKSSPYSRRNSKYSRSRSRSSSAEFWRRSRHRSPYLWQSSHSRARSPLFTSDSSDEGHADQPYLWRSRSSIIHLSRSRSRSPRSQQSKHREVSSNDRIRIWSRRKRYETAEDPESDRSRSGHSARRNYRERTGSSDRMVGSQLQVVSPPPYTEYSSHRRESISPYKRWESSFRDRSRSGSRLVRSHSRDESGYRQQSRREGHRSGHPSLERNERERLSGYTESFGYSDEKAEFHFHNGVWYDSDLDHPSNLSATSSKKYKPKSKNTTKRNKSITSPSSDAGTCEQKKVGHQSFSSPSSPSKEDEPKSETTTKRTESITSPSSDAGTCKQKKVDHPSVSSPSSPSKEDKPKSENTTKRTESITSPLSDAGTCKQRKDGDYSVSNAKNEMPSINDKENN